MKKLILAMMMAAVTALSAKADVPRAEYPRPQFVRDQWQNLNGQWTYELDKSLSGMDRKLYESQGFADEITVPFCPESKLSGVQHLDFIPGMWYHRTVQRPAEWEGKRTMLNFGAVDFFATVYIDGQMVGRHWGGSAPFSLDITDYVADGEPHNLVVRVEDDTRSGVQPLGKQSQRHDSYSCLYTRTTGIWQTVWMEPVDAYGLADVYIVPDLDGSRFVVQPTLLALQPGQTVEVTLLDGGKAVSRAKAPAAPGMSMNLPVKNVKTWSPESPFLYDVAIDVRDAQGNVIDHVDSYAGMRKFHIEGNNIYLNNEPIFLRLVLDQGFYPEGIWTAPSDEALRHDIELSQAAGFNGARLHQKVFEPRFHYWADKMGYLTWGEFPSWGADANRIESARNFLPEWEEVVVRDRNHPSIIVWTPFNETWERPVEAEAAMQHDRLLTDVYNATHRLDYRPVNDTSGNYHVITDIWTVHRYDQDPEVLADYLTVKDGHYPCSDQRREVEYGGQPFIIDEYGGIKWVHGKQYSADSWGYGEGPKTLDEYYKRLEAQTDVVLAVPFMMGYCYTQLTDVELEQNGIYNYDRTPKFDMEIIRSIFSKTPSADQQP